jgi:ATP-dependent DNA helicase RecQ
MNPTSLIENVLEQDIMCSEALLLLRRKLEESSLSSKDVFVLRCAVRLVNRYGQWNEGTASVKDFAATLRNYILYCNRIRAPLHLIAEIRDCLDPFAMYVEFDEYLNVHAGCPPWFEQQHFFDVAFWRVQTEPVKQTLSIGDGRLKDSTGYMYYRCLEQKLAVDAAFNMPNGYTMLLCMPTGSGKSLITQVITGLGKGLTLVVVPTVALAIDQVRAARSSLKSIRKDNIACYYGGMSKDDLECLRSSMEGQRLRLLFTSPEALLKNSPINHWVMKAAEEGFLENVVIDEAHIVPEWGDQFRPDFQYLSILRRQLLELSSGRIRTYLLSATITDYAGQILRQLFADEDKWIEIRADSLRQEPRYCFVGCKEDREKRDRVIEMAHVMPRPMIIYTLNPNEAEEYRRLFLRSGFKAIEVFTGETDNIERERIIQAWNSDLVDVIIATSAFGMGVDKPDIRTVVHAYIPENLNHYYQQLGRGGRDGLPSLSILCTYRKADMSGAFDLIKRRVLRTESIIGRWQGMITNKQIRFEEDRFTLDTSAKPVYMDETHVSGRMNISWNLYVILFLFRYQLLDLVDMWPNSATQSYNVEVRARDTELFHNLERFRNTVGILRDEEKKRVRSEFKMVQKLIRRPNRICWNHFFLEMYPLAEDNCGGCPLHDEPSFQFDKTALRARANLPARNLPRSEWIAKRLSNYDDMLICVDSLDLNGAANMETVAVLLGRLLTDGIGNVVIPKAAVKMWDQIYDRLPSCCLGSVYTTDEVALLCRQNPDFIQPAIACIYGKDVHENNHLFNAVTDIQRRIGTKVIHCGQRNMFIRSQSRYLENVVDGYVLDFESFVKEG